jgi:hypothetical protein
MKAPNPPITITADAMFLTVSIESLLPVHQQSFSSSSHTITARQPSSGITVAMLVREADRLSPFYGDKLRGEATSLREAEASQPRDYREPTCQTITIPRCHDEIPRTSISVALRPTWSS